MMALREAANVTKTYLDDYPDVDPHSCQLLGPTALVVQGVMGVLVILSLVYKRHREKPKRPWRIWLFDVSKQVVGQMFVHGVNVLMSDIVAHNKSSNPCVPYFLNILLDTTLGVGIIYAILHLLTFVLTEKLGLKGFESGKYGSPPSILFWIRQASIYVLALTTMKLTVLLLFVMFPGIFTIGEWLLGWTWRGKGDFLQVIFTMGLFPIMMNILQFWLIDSIVKASGVVALPVNSHGNLFEDADREPLFDVPSDDDDDDDDDNNIGRARHDIENPRPPSASESINKSQSGVSAAAEAKPTSSSDSSTAAAEPRDIPNTHSYPPSIASSSTSASVSSSHAGRTSRIQKQFKRRPAPPPLDLESPSDLAANISLVVPIVREVKPEHIVVEPSKEWDESWGDSDDWAHKVGDDEWTGPRIAERKDALNTWNETAIPGAA